MGVVQPDWKPPAGLTCWAPLSGAAMCVPTSG
eukprot:CAMPEP_0185159842 /NCGR_PEP_ID=MMETSP1139-20130426/3291_1 /TAXON_ID=298111 /ORGANISM="Pavlova sp., Strain CCMP459" /LENGTH=31 /DNA_ID= /DNA_START= /DNA_END= /DNA_ORIENTATION=